MEDKFKNLVTQAQYARFIKRSRARVCQLVKSGRLDAVWVGGNKLVRLTPKELSEYQEFAKN